MLTMENINTCYGSIQVLYNVSLELGEGEIVCVLGANGAGKTTTINTIIGMAKSPRGKIYLNKERIDKLDTEKIIERGISIVPEGRRLFSKLTVLENLRMGALFNRDENAFKINYEKVCNLFPIFIERKNQYAGTLSGGEQGMLAIGRAMISNPKIMLLDEPSMGLAPILVSEVFESLVKFKRDDTSMLLVEQNPNQALKIASRGYVLSNGSIVEEGSVGKLMETEVIKKAYLLG
jgi:branched-chain amino acid transport system ATP-binding protein